MYKCAVYNFKQSKDLGYKPLESDSLVESSGYLSTADLVRSILEVGSVPASMNDPDKMAYDEVDGHPVDPDNPDLCTPVFSDKIEVLQHIKEKRENVSFVLNEMNKAQATQSKQPASPQNQPASAVSESSSSSGSSEA